MIKKSLCYSILSDENNWDSEILRSNSYKEYQISPEIVNILKNCNILIFKYSVLLRYLGNSQHLAELISMY